jgi:multidrug transporter EmrE-like cation transporter
MSTAKSIIFIITSVLLSGIGQTFLKVGLNRVTNEQKSTVAGFVKAAFTTWPVWLGLGLFVLSVVVWMRVLADSDLSWAYPMLGLSYVFVAISGWLVFKETLTVGRISGIVLVIAGAVLVGRS